ncbi:MAG TPA: hypothetical protein VFR47_21870 [Anaerolineales bacterium]|nr:hypothetical protein [Anaerolineales bacterium]
MLNLPINLRRVVGIIFIVILAFAVLEFNRRLEELKLLDKQHELVFEQATQAVQTQVALQTRVAYAGSTAAVEEWARSEGKYIQDGDLPMVPITQPGAAPMEVATLAPQPTPQPNWLEWWDLFFGEQ